MEYSKKKCKLSVVIPTYNRSKLLSYSLKSIVLQDIGKSEIEVIVADDGSSDNTKEIVDSFKDKLDISYVYQPDKGYRPGSARNLGIKAARGEIIMFVDSGVILNSNCIREHINFHSASDDDRAVIGFVYGFDRGPKSEAMLLKLVDPENPAESFKRITGHPVFLDVRDHQYIIYNDQIQDLPAPWLYFWTCHTSATRRSLLKIGLFDEVFDGRWGVEDNELGFRLVQDGVKIHFLRSAEALHYPHSKDLPGLLEQGYKNCQIFYEKHGAIEIKLFLDNYRNIPFADINALRMQMLDKVTEQEQRSFNG